MKVFECTLEEERWYADAYKHNLGGETPNYMFKIENYMTDGPGYCGDIYFAVWGGDPSYVDVFLPKASIIKVDPNGVNHKVHITLKRILCGGAHEACGIPKGG